MKNDEHEHELVLVSLQISVPQFRSTSSSDSNSNYNITLLMKLQYPRQEASKVDWASNALSLSPILAAFATTLLAVLDIEHT